MTKNWQKRYLKHHPAPQKLKFYMKKIVFLYSKRPPSPSKNRNFLWKNDKKLTKKGTKKSIQPRKNGSFAKKKSIFLLKKTSQPRKKLKFCMKKWQKIDKKLPPKNHPAPQKREVLHEKLKRVYNMGFWKKNRTSSFFIWAQKNSYQRYRLSILLLQLHISIRSIRQKHEY